MWMVSTRTALVRKTASARASTFVSSERLRLLDMQAPPRAMRDQLMTDIRAALYRHSYYILCVQSSSLGRTVQRADSCNGVLDVL